MDLIPPFEIGLLNAWILILIEIMTHRLLTPKNKKPFRKDETKELSYNEKLTRTVGLSILLSFRIYAIFLPFKIGTIWFNIGLPIAIFGLIMNTIVLVNRANAPPGKPFTNGLFRYSRHPMYFFGAITCIGISIATLSWLFFVLILVYKILQYKFSRTEERYCLKKFGDEYKEYMNNTPRFFGIPKSQKKSK